MKRLLLMTLAMLLCFSIPSMGQEKLDLKLSYRNAQLSRVLNDFTAQTGVTFSYETSLGGSLIEKVEVNLHGASLAACLDAVFGETNFTYKVDGLVVALSFKENEIVPKETKKKVTVTGVVSDAIPAPLPGAVVLSSDGASAITDMDGKYTIEVQPDAVLTFTMLGFKDVQEKVSGQSELNITMTDDVQLLDEIVVVGYGTQSRKTLTTSVAKISGEKFEDVPVTTVGDAIKGKVSGLRVATSNTTAGSEPRFLIRGGSSISMSNDPVVIVDGLTRTLADINPNDIESIEVLKDAASAGIYGARASNGVILVTTKKGNTYRKPEIVFEATVGFTQPERFWNLMNSEEYLAWVRPAALQGPNSAVILNGANGAGTGNTASGSTYTTRFLEWGETVADGWKWMEDPINPGRYLTFTDTDYQRQWLRTALYHKEYIGVNGGNDKMRYMASMSFLGDDGMVNMNKHNAFTMHSNVSFKVTDNLEASTKLDFSRTVTNTLVDNYFDSYGRSVMLAPTHRDFDVDGRWITGGTNKNQQIASFYDKFYDREKGYERFTGSFNLKWNILDGLTANAQYAIYNQTYSGSYYEHGEVNDTPNYISALRNTTETRSQLWRWNAQAFVNYNKAFGKHKIDATAGFDYMQWRNTNVTTKTTGSESDKVPTLSSGLDFTADNTDTEEALMSFFARTGYNYDDRYVASFVIRADGSSKFVKGNRWGFFPAGSFAWVVSEEPFWNSRKMNTLKARLSYGQTGNNGIGLYDAVGAYVYDKYNGQTMLPSNMKNASLRWETTTQLDFGVDMGFFNDRIRLVTDFYDKVTDNMLFSITLPDTGSFGSVPANVGSVRFYGFELELSTANIERKNFSWTTDITYSFNRNIVLSLPDEYKYKDLNGKDAWRIGGYTMTESGERFGGTAVGEPLGRIWGYKVSHIIQTEAEADAAYFDALAFGYRRTDGKSIAGRKDAGDYEWCNRPGSALTSDGKEQINGEDMYCLGNVMPHSMGGINNTFRFKGLTVSIYFDYAIGHSISNYMKSRFITNTFANCNANVDKDIAAGTWRFPGDAQAKAARFFPNDSDFGNKNFSRTSDFNVERADYLCLRDVSISYDLPQKWVEKMRMKKLTIGVSGNTLHYFTGVTGAINPETGMGSGSSDGMYSAVSTASSNGNILPAGRRVVFNLKVTF